MTLTWTLQLSLAPLQNALLAMHWTKREKLKSRIGLELLRKQPRPKRPLPGRPRVTLVRRSHVRPDPDNGFGGKLVLDVLARLGWIADDSADAIELVCRWEKAPPGKGSLVVEVCAP